MFGHHELAQAKVLYSEMVITAWEEEHHTTYEFVLEVQPANGQAFRAKTRHSFPSFTPHPEVGDMVYVKYDPKSLKVELHVHGDNRYGWKGEKQHEQAQRQAEQARVNSLLSASPGTPVSPANAAGGAGMGGLDPELQELLDLEEAERRAAQAGGQQRIVQQGQSVQMSPGSPDMAAQVNPQAALAMAEAQMLRQQLEHTGASGQAKLLRKQQAGALIGYFAPFFVEVQVQPDNMGYPFQCSFTTWIDTSKVMLVEGYTLPVRYDPQNTVRMVFLTPA